MKFVRSALSVAFVAAIAAIGAPAMVAQAQTVLTVSTPTPPKHPFTHLLQKEWADMVEKESDGILKIQFLPKAPMGAAQTFDGVRDGLVDISFISHGNSAGRFRLTRIAEFPFLADDAETLSVAYQRVFERSLAGVNEHEGVIPLSVFTPGPGHLMSLKVPYDNMAALQGQKLRAPGGMAFELAGALGATPISRPSSELYELLNGGIVDGALMPADGFGGWRLEDIIKHVVSVPGGLYNASFALVMNEDKYNSLTDEERAALAKVTGETFSRIAGITSDNADQRGFDIYKGKGGEIHIAPDAFVEEIRAATGHFEEEWVKDVADTGVDAAAALADLRAEIAKIKAE